MFGITAAVLLCDYERPIQGRACYVTEAELQVLESVPVEVFAEEGE